MSPISACRVDRSRPSVAQYRLSPFIDGVLILPPGRGREDGPFPFVTMIHGGTYAANVTTPVLILHGADDTNVPVGQAMYFHRALTHFGTEHDLVI